MSKRAHGRGRVLDGYIGENFARQRYGVVIVDGRLNEAAAARLRASHMGG